jgi:hypothetical protein
MSRTGDIHNLPAEQHPDPDRKPGRPWLLVHTPGDGKRHVLAYGTTQDTEAVEGATALDIRWRRLSGTFTESRFVTARLRNHDPAEIGDRVGHARAYGDEIRASFAAALGIGTGIGAGAAGSIERGQVVALHGIIRERIGARWAVLITRPDYARRRRHQILLPVHDAEEVDLMDGEIRSRAAWVAALPGAPAEAVLAVPSIFSECEAGRPRSPGGIVGVVASRLDAASMREIDGALTAYFGL